MSYLRIQVSLLFCLCLTGPACAAVADDLNPLLLLMQTTDKSGRCSQGGGAKGADGCCGTSFQAMPGSVASRGAKNLCFGSQSISVFSSGAVSQVLTQQALPLVYGTAGGGGGGGSRRAEPATGTPYGGASSEPGASSFFSDGGGTPNVGVPGPAAGAGLPFLLVAGAYALVRRRRRAGGVNRHALA